ncbi:MAG TPA: hypothetical protein ENG69_00665 [Candidatus Korarchaeota archaeon]|nr:hypothetical protein [Candidatus Korarchaeota archaeon]
MQETVLGGSRSTILALFVLTVLVSAFSYASVYTQPSGPYYYRAEALLEFHSEDRGTFTLKQSLYGDLALALKQTIESLGEEVYVNSVRTILLQSLVNRTLITGYYDFTLDGEPSVKIDFSGAEPPVATVTISFDLIGRPPSEPIKALIYQMDPDHPWLYRLYTEPLAVRMGNSTIITPLYELNLTVVLPEGYCIESGGPRATMFKVVGTYPNQRIVLNWFVTNPELESRGTALRGFGPMYFILDRPDPEIISRFNELEGRLASARPVDPSAYDELLTTFYDARERVLAFCAVEPDLLNQLESQLANVTGTSGQLSPAMIWAASLGVSALLLAAAAFLRRGRSK